VVSQSDTPPDILVVTFAMLLNEPSPIDVRLELSVFAGVRSVPRQHTWSAVADIGDTLAWGGIHSATLPDGTSVLPFPSVTGPDGTDFKNAVPAPGAATALLCSGIALVRRRRS